MPKRPLPENACPTCLKPTELCVCSLVSELFGAERSARKGALKVLILQHPQEPDQELGTGLMTTLALGEGRARLKTGLSWRNLRHAWGDGADEGPAWAPSRWAVLYLGAGARDGNDAAGARTDSSGKRIALPDERPEVTKAADSRSPLVWLDAKGRRTQAPEPGSLQGIVLLDGTWSQAKALWWRNAWLLKLRRAVLAPKRPSAYGALRREPRRECLSTLETAAETLRALGEPAQTADALHALFDGLLKLYRARGRRPARAPESL